MYFLVCPLQTYCARLSDETKGLFTLVVAEDTRRGSYQNDTIQTRAPLGLNKDGSKKDGQQQNKLAEPLRRIRGVTPHLRWQKLSGINILNFSQNRTYHIDNSV